MPFHLASKENIQTHGGMGFTWEFDCHLYYRRAKLLALTLGSATRTGRTGWSTRWDGTTPAGTQATH